MTKSQSKITSEETAGAPGLALFEELFLLTIDDEDGALLPGVAPKVAFGIGGALLADMAMRNRLRVGDNHRLELTDASPTGDALLDQILELIQAAEQPRKVGYWVRNLANEPKQIRQQLVERLVSAGVLQQDENHLLWAEHSEGGASAKYALKLRLRQAILTDSQPAERDLALLSLAKASKLLNLIFTKDERKKARRRIYELLVEKALKDPLAQTIQEIEMAVETQLNAA